MKKIFILLILFIFGVTLQLIGQTSFSISGEMSGLQQIITLYGEELNLTDEQKETLIGMSLDHRRAAHQTSMRPVRQHRADRRENRNMDRERGERTQREFRGEGNNNRSVLLRQPGTYQRVYEVLTEEQAEHLKSILTEHAQRQHEYRTLQYATIIDRAGLDEDKAIQIEGIFEKQSQARTDLSIQRIQNSGETDRERTQELRNDIREGNLQVKEILTAAEYEKLMRAMSPMSHRQQSSFRRSAPRSR